MTGVIAWVALVVSSASLSWQVVSWLRSGPRLDVSIAMERPPGMESGKECSYLVVVTNTGRQAVTVLDVLLRLQKGRDRGPRRRSGAPVFPRKFEPTELQPGAEVCAAWPTDQVDRALANLNATRDDLVAGVRTGNRWVWCRAKGISGHRLIVGRNARLIIGSPARLLNRRRVDRQVGRAST